VSKFFKALENAEREREAGVAPTTPVVAPAGTAPTPAEAPAPGPPLEPRPPDVRPTAYGAPLVPETTTTRHRRLFSGLLEAPDDEPGQPDDHLVSLLAPTSPAAEQYRSVRLHIETLRRERGLRVVAISSPGSHRVLPDYIAVGASKAALEALVRYLAVELAPMNIVVNAVSPGLVLTDALQYFSSLREADVIPRAIAQTPAGRLVTPEDVAGVVAFLCSPQAFMIRGQVIILDGGYTLPVP